MLNKPSLISTHHLSKKFQVEGQTLCAVEDLNLSIYPGETLGLVGESGCGKSTVGRLLLRLQEASTGHIFFHEQDLTLLNKSALLPYRRRMQMIFQDPHASLNPRMTVQELIGEPLDIHQLAKGQARKDRIAELLELVGLQADHMSRYPHEFSGGQLQRIGIARALAVEPEFIVCDEAISALDVSVQAQVVQLLKDLQRRMGLTYLFIAHDLAMVEYISNRVAVMYLGRLVELAPSQELYNSPLHPYTQALLSAIPVPDPKIERHRKRIVLQGSPPSALHPPTGCVFHTRCPFAMDICQREVPAWKEHKPGHFAACHLHNEKLTQLPHPEELPH